MAVNIVNFLSQAFSSSNKVRSTSISPVSNNPFANPFVNSTNSQSNPYYAKNKPVQGGYFAGYYNGRPNVVGQRLFIEA